MIISNTINLDSVNGKIDLTNIKSLFSAESYGLVCQMLTDIEAHCLMMEPEPGIEKISRLKGLDAEKWAKSYLSKIYPLYSPLVSTLMLTIIEELNWIFSSEKKKELKIATGLAEGVLNKIKDLDIQGSFSMYPTFLGKTDDTPTYLGTKE